MNGGRYTGQVKTEQTNMQQDTDPGSSKRRPNILLIVMLAAIAVMAAVQIILRPIIVTGDSMSPAYENGELLLTNRIKSLTDIDYGTVIVFKDVTSGNKLYIKRVEGLPGDNIRIEDGYLIRNGEIIDEGLPLMENAGMAEQNIIIPEESVFVLGDNRNASKDSREIGPVSISDIRGTARAQRDPE